MQDTKIAVFFNSLILEYKEVFEERNKRRPFFNSSWLGIYKRRKAKKWLVEAVEIREGVCRAGLRGRADLLPDSCL